MNWWQSMLILIAVLAVAWLIVTAVYALMFGAVFGQVVREINARKITTETTDKDAHGSANG